MYRINSGADPAAVAAREERDQAMNERVDAAARQRLADLETRGKKECANWSCGAEIDTDATRCEFCGKRQGTSHTFQTITAGRPAIRIGPR